MIFLKRPVNPRKTPVPYLAADSRKVRLKITGMISEKKSHISIYPSRKVARPVFELIYREHAILSHFLAEQLGITLLCSPCGRSLIAQLESLIL